MLQHFSKNIKNIRLLCIVVQKKPDHDKREKKKNTGPGNFRQNDSTTVKKLKFELGGGNNDKRDTRF